MRIAAWLEGEASKCMYCGFCEPACPTLEGAPSRAYGPRGRVRIALLASRGSGLGEESLDALYTCLLCAACHDSCPAGIDIVGVVRAARALLSGKPEA